MKYRMTHFNEIAILVGWKNAKVYVAYLFQN